MMLFTNIYGYVTDANTAAGNDLKTHPEAVKLIAENGPLIA